MKKLLLALGLFLFPVLVFAQVDTDFSGIDKILAAFGRLIALAVPIVISLAILVFLWGVLRYVIASDEEAKGKGKNMMLWGIVGIFVMISVWGLVGILQKSFGLENSDEAPEVPELPVND